MTDHLEQSVEKLYAAALGNASWDECVSSICDVVGSEIGSIFAYDTQRPALETAEFLGVVGYDPETVLQSEFEWTDDPYQKPVELLPAFVPQIGSRHVTTDSLDRSDSYKFTKRHLRFDDLAWIKLTDGPNLGMMVIYRSTQAGCFENDCQDRLKPFATHLRNALSIHFRLFSEPSPTPDFQLLGAQLPYGIIVVDADCRIAHANNTAQKIFRTGATFGSINGILRAQDLKADQSLNEKVRAMTNFGVVRDANQLQHHVLVPNINESSYAIASVSPLTRPKSLFAQQYALQKPTALIVVSDGSTVDQLNMASIQTLFGLTPAEARTVVGLCKGHSVREIAELNSVSINTIRFHLKSLFAKTGTKRQGELVHLILSSPAIGFDDG